MDNSEDIMRANRGLGAIISSMGQGKVPEKTEAVPVAKNKEVINLDEKAGFDLQSEGFSGWGDIQQGDSKSDEANANNQDDSNSKTDEGSKEVARSEGEKRAAEPEGTKENKKPKPDTSNEVYGQRELVKWSDMLEFNDDHDQDWFDAENTFLAKKYGEGIITTTYIEQQPGKIGYYCKICFAEMNARKSLELHCSGMKHLKKKNIWDKSKDDPEKNLMEPPRFKDRREMPVGPSLDNRPRGRDNYRPDSRRGGPRDDYYRDSAPSSTGWNYNHSSTNRDMEPWESRSENYARHRDYTPPFHFGGPSEYGRPGPSDPPAYHSYHERGASNWDRYDERRDPYYDDDRWGDRDQYRDHDRAHDFEKRMRSRSPFSRDYSLYPDERSVFNRLSSPPPAPSVSDTPIFTAKRNMPPISSNLSGSADQDGNMLKKLASCSVKSREDAGIALQLALMLLNSLKNYHEKGRSTNIVHLLEDTIVKLNIMMALED